MLAEVSIGQEPAARVDRRRASRLVILVPVEIQWQTPDGEIATREGLARNVDIRGALVQVKAFGHQKNCTDPNQCRCERLAGRNFPNSRMEMDLKNVSSGDTVRARVIHIRRSSDGQLDNIGIEMLEPTDTFWGVTFQLQRALIELEKIEDSFQSKERQVDFRVRRNLREAVEYVRIVGSIVQQWQDLRAQGKDGYSVLELLSSARVNRAAHVLRELTSDIDASELASDTDDYANLSQTVERLYERMTRGPALVRETE